MNVNKIEYEFNWCEFLTPCPNGMDYMVGDFDCGACEFCKKNIVITNVEGEDYKRYVDVGSGIVHCTFKNK